MTGKQLSPERKADRSKRIVDLVERLGLSYGQIGSRLGIHPNFVNYLYRKTVKILKR